MSAEIHWMAATGVLTTLMFLPYILGYIGKVGLTAACVQRGDGDALAEARASRTYQYGREFCGFRAACACGWFNRAQHPAYRRSGGGFFLVPAGALCGLRGGDYGVAHAAFWRRADLPVDPGGGAARPALNKTKNGGHRAPACR